MTTKEMINKNYAWYEKNQKELYRKYPEKFLVITDETVKWVFDSLEEAYDFMSKEKLIWKSLLQQCEKDIQFFNFHWIYQIN